MRIQFSIPVGDRVRNMAFLDCFMMPARMGLFNFLTLFTKGKVACTWLDTPTVFSLVTFESGYRVTEVTAEGWEWTTLAEGGLPTLLYYTGFRKSWELMTKWCVAIQIRQENGSNLYVEYFK